MSVSVCVYGHSLGGVAYIMAAVLVTEMDALVDGGTHALPRLGIQPRVG